MTTLRFTLCTLLVATACSKSESRDSSAPAATKAVEAPAPKPAVDPAPAPAPAPTAQPSADGSDVQKEYDAAEQKRMAADDAAEDAKAATKCGGSPQEHGVCVIQKIANVIDAAGTDCEVIATKLAPLSKDVKDAIAVLMTEGQQFKTLDLSKELVAQRKAQAKVLATCGSNANMKAAIAKTLGKMKSYDREYDGGE